MHNPVTKISTKSFRGSLFRKLKGLTGIALILTAHSVSMAPPICAQGTSSYTYHDYPFASEWARIQNPAKFLPGVNLDPRDIASFILEAQGQNKWSTISTGKTASPVYTALKLLRSYQDTNPSSPTYGNFAIEYSKTAAGNSGTLQVTDPNWARFVLQILAPLAKISQNGDKFPASSDQQQAKQLLLQILKDGSHALEYCNTSGTHYQIGGNVPGQNVLFYTNQALMEFQDQILVGESLSDTNLAQAGYTGLAALNEAYFGTSGYGIPEYESANYWGIDLDCLGLISQQSSNASARGLAQRILRQFWTQIAAVWSADNSRMGTAESREYNYLLQNDQPMNNHLVEAGWAQGTVESNKTFLQCGNWIPNFTPSQLYPSSTRFVSYKVGPVHQQIINDNTVPNQHYVTDYVSPHFNISVASAAFGPQDLPLNINVPETPPADVSTPTSTTSSSACYFVMGDIASGTQGNPYGAVTPMNAYTAEFKAYHAVPYIASAQNGTPDVLFSSTFFPFGNGYATRGCQNPGDPQDLYSHFVFPAGCSVLNGNTSITTDGQIIDTSKPIFITTPKNNSGAQITIAIWILVATKVDDHPALVHYHNDGTPSNDGSALATRPGTGVSAARISIEHADGVPTKCATTAFYVHVFDGDITGPTDLKVRQFRTWKPAFEFTGNPDAVKNGEDSTITIQAGSQTRYGGNNLRLNVNLTTLQRESPQVPTSILEVTQDPRQPALSTPGPVSVVAPGPLNGVRPGLGSTPLPPVASPKKPSSPPTVSI